MGWLSNIFKKAKRPNASLQTNVTMNGYQPNFTAFGNNILLSNIIYSAVAMKARYLGVLKPKYIIKEEKETREIKDSSISAILKRPNNFQTTYDFLTQAFFMREKNDNCFIYPDYFRNSKNEKIYTGMYILLPCDSPIVLQDNSGKLFIRFLFLNPDREVVFPYEDIIHWKQNIEDNQFSGGGRYRSSANADLLTSLQTYRTGQETIAEASKFGCMFDGILKINAYAAEDEKVKKIRDDFVNDLRSNKAKLPVLDNGVDYQQIQRSLKVMDEATLKEIKESVALHTGLTLDMICGKMTEEEKETFYENWIRPSAISLAQAMERVFFSSEQLSAGHEIVIYPTDMELMSSRERFRYCDMLMKAGAITINEVRRSCGLPPVADGDLRPRGYNNLDGYKLKLEGGLTTDDEEQEQE